jgi:hypothetical protein
MQQAAQTADVLEIRYVHRRRLTERLGLALEGAVERGVRRAVDGLSAREDRFR